MQNSYGIAEVQNIFREASSSRPFRNIFREASGSSPFLNIEEEYLNDLAKLSYTDLLNYFSDHIELGETKEQLNIVKNNNSVLVDNNASLEKRLSDTLERLSELDKNLELALDSNEKMHKSLIDKETQVSNLVEALCWIAKNANANNN